MRYDKNSALRKIMKAISRMGDGIAWPQLARSCPPHSQTVLNLKAGAADFVVKTSGRATLIAKIVPVLCNQ